MSSVAGTKMALRSCVAELSAGIEQTQARLERDGHAEPLVVTDPNGRSILLDALTAKANALAALGQLEALRG